MATKLQIRRGNLADLPDLSEGELAFALDEKQLFIGHEDGNVQILTGDAGVASNAATADELTNARTISLAGDVTGSVNFDGSANVTITATVVDDSHSHIIGNVDGLQTALNTKLEQSDLDTALEDYTDTTTLDAALALKAPLASPTFTGAPLAPTAQAGTNTTQIATTAFVTTAINTLDAAKADYDHNHTLNSLSNISISSLANGDVLKWDSTLQKWTNQEDDFGGEGGGESDPVFLSSPAGSITNGTGLLKNNGSGTWSYDNSTYLTSASNLSGLNITSSGVSARKVLMADGDGTSSFQNILSETVLLNTTTMGLKTISALTNYDAVIIQLKTIGGTADNDDDYVYEMLERQVIPISNFSYTSVSKSPFPGNIITQKGGKITGVAAGSTTPFSVGVIANNTLLTQISVILQSGSLPSTSLFSISIIGVKY